MSLSNCLYEKNGNGVQEVLCLMGQPVQHRVHRRAVHHWLDAFNQAQPKQVKQEGGSENPHYVLQEPFSHRVGCCLAHTKIDSCAGSAMLAASRRYKRRWLLGTCGGRPLAAWSSTLTHTVSLLGWIHCSRERLYTLWWVGLIVAQVAKNFSLLEQHRHTHADEASHCTEPGSRDLVELS